MAIRVPAVGFRAEPGNKVGYNLVQEYQWTSTDGRSWDEVPPGTELGSRLFYFQDVVAGPSDSFIAYLGVSYGLDSGLTKNAVWQSPDGRTWQEADTDLDPGLQISMVVQGARGYLLLAQSLGTDPSLWLSADGLHWEEVHRFTDATHYVGVDDISAPVTRASSRLGSAPRWTTRGSDSHSHRLMDVNGLTPPSRSAPKTSNTAHR